MENKAKVISTIVAIGELAKWSEDGKTQAVKQTVGVFSMPGYQNHFKAMCELVKCGYITPFLTDKKPFGVQVGYFDDEGLDTDIEIITTTLVNYGFTCASNKDKLCRFRQQGVVPIDYSFVAYKGDMQGFIDKFIETELLFGGMIALPVRELQKIGCTFYADTGISILDKDECLSHAGSSLAVFSEDMLTAHSMLTYSGTCKGRTTMKELLYYFRNTGDLNALKQSDQEQIKRIPVCQVYQSPVTGAEYLVHAYMVSLLKEALLTPGNVFLHTKYSKT